MEVMWFLYWFSLILSLIIYIPILIIEERENEEEPEHFYNILYCVIVAMLPLLNTLLIILGFLILIIKITRKIYVNTTKIIKTKKHPETEAIILLEEIYKFYEVECKKNKVPKEIRKFKRNLKNIIKFLTNNHRGKNVSNLLFTYEITFKKILNAFNTSESFNDVNKRNILLISHKAIEMFELEIEQIKRKSAKMEEIINKTLTTRLIDELKGDRLYHQVSTDPTLRKEND